MAKYAYHRIDATQQAIFDTLRAGGMSVIPGGPLDGIGGLNGHCVLLECKTRTGTLRPKQEKIVKDFQGHVAVLRNEADATALLLMFRLYPCELGRIAGASHV